MPLVPRNQSARRSSLASSPPATTAAATSNLRRSPPQPQQLAGQLVTDTIVVTPAESHRQRDAVSAYKFEVCTPVRQQRKQAEAMMMMSASRGVGAGDATGLAAFNQHQQPSFSSSRRGTTATPTSSLDLARTATPTSIQQQQQNAMSGRSSPDRFNNNSNQYFSPSPPAGQVTSFGGTTTPRRGSGGFPVIQQHNFQRTHLPPERHYTPPVAELSRRSHYHDHHHHRQKKYNDASPTDRAQKNATPSALASVTEQLDTFCMNFASEQHRYERRRHQLEASSTQQHQQSATATSSAPPSHNNSNGDGGTTHHQHSPDSRSSSTDSIIVDPGVMQTNVQKNSMRRTGRLREHFSPSLATLNQVSTSTEPVVMSYLIGLERLVQFCFNTLGSKDELAAVIGAVSSLSGLAESAMSFGRWPCFNLDSLHSRLEKVLTVKLDRRALFDSLAGVLGDGRVIHAVLLSALRLAYFAPSAAHFLEFLLTVLFVHQTSLTQADCQVIYRFLTSPHPLRFLVRGRKDNFAPSSSSSAAAAVAVATATPPSSSGGDPSLLAASPSSSSSRIFLSGNNNGTMARSIREGLESPASEVNAKVATEELYFLIDYLASSSTLAGGVISWADLQRIVTPPDDALGDTMPTMTNDSFSSMMSAAAADAAGGGGDTSNAKRMSATNAHNINNNAVPSSDAAVSGSGGDSFVAKAAKRQREQAAALQRRHDAAMSAHRKAAGGDKYASSTKRKLPSECVIVARLMSEMRNP